MTLTNRLFLFVVATLSCMGCDQATKLLAQVTLKEAPALVFWDNFLRLEYAENRGAFLSLGANLSDHYRWLLLTVVASAVLIALAIYLCLHRELRQSEILGYSLILAGGVSNMMDRITTGFVVDFLNIGIGTVRTGIFNVADVSIMAGLLIVVAAHWQNLRQIEAETSV